MLEKKSKTIDYLIDDPSIPNQKFVCLSFLSPEGIKNCSIRGIKVRGVFDTEEEANAWAKHLIEIDDTFHIFVGAVGKWMAWDPDPNSVQDQVYKDQQLNQMAKAYKENLTKAKVMHETRKKDMLEKAMKEEKERQMDDKHKATVDRLQKKLDKKRLDKKMEEHLQSVDKTNDLPQDVKNMFDEEPFIPPLKKKKRRRKNKKKKSIEERDVEITKNKEKLDSMVKKMKNKEKQADKIRDLGKKIQTIKESTKDKPDDGSVKNSIDKLESIYNSFKLNI